MSLSDELNVVLQASLIRAPKHALRGRRQMIGNISPTNHHLTHKRHVEAIVERKDPYHHPPDYPCGQKSKTGFQGCFPLDTHVHKTTREGHQGWLSVILFPRPSIKANLHCYVRRLSFQEKPTPTKKRRSLTLAFKGSSQKIYPDLDLTVGDTSITQHFHPKATSHAPTPLDFDHVAS